MTVYIVHAPGDAAVAEKAARLFEREGVFVETEDGAHAFAPLKGRDVVALLWSSDADVDPARPALLGRAIDAWAQGRLAIAALDGAMPPPALADLPRVSAAADDAVAPLAEAVRTLVRQAAPMEAAAPTPAPAPVKRKAGAARLPLAAAAALAWAIACAGAGYAYWVGWSPQSPLAGLGGAAAAAGVAAAIAALALTVAAMLAGGRKRVEAPPTERRLAVVGDQGRVAALAPAFAAMGVEAVPAEATRTRADLEAVLVVASPDGLAHGPSQRAVLQAARANLAIALLRDGTADTPGDLAAILEPAPNAAWPGEPRAAAALALSLLDLRVSRA